MGEDEGRRGSVDLQTQGQSDAEEGVFDGWDKRKGIETWNT